MTSLLISFLILCHCKTVQPVSIDHQDLTIKLRWVKSYNGESQEKVEIGLKWILSYLGAMLPLETMHEAIVWSGERLIELDLSKAGFTSSSLRAWNQILEDYKQSDEYQMLGSWDLGRFIMMSYNQADNYYKITGAEKDFKNFKSKYQFKSENTTYLLPGQSGVTNGLRKISFIDENRIDQIAHIAEEGTGEDLASFEAKEFEVFDFMPNGQPRFAVYNLNGNLQSGGSSELSFAGKPAKCMWCHESGVQLPFKIINDNPNRPELMSDFKNLVEKQNAILDVYYEDLTSKIDSFRFDKRSHFLAELLYLTYQSPTKSRAKNELRAAGKSLRTYEPKVLEQACFGF